MSNGTTNLGAGFASQEARYLEPPDVSHHDACEVMRWYWCKDCDHPFMENDSRPINMCDCGQAFNKRYDECICEWIRS